MLLAIPTEILILIIIMLLFVAGVVAVMFYAASKRIANPDNDPQMTQDEKQP